MHDEEEEGRAERASLLDAHRARHRHGLAAKVECHLQIRIQALNDVDQVWWHAELGEHDEEHIPGDRVERLDQIHEQHPRLEPVLPPLLQSMANAEASVHAAASAGEAVLLLDADLLQQPLQAIIDNH